MIVREPLRLSVPSQEKIADQVRATLIAAEHEHLSYTTIEGRVAAAFNSPYATHPDFLNQVVYLENLKMAIRRVLNSWLNDHNRLIKQCGKVDFNHGRHLCHQAMVDEREAIEGFNLYCQCCGHQLIQDTAPAADLPEREARKMICPLCPFETA